MLVMYYYLLLSLKYVCSLDAALIVQDTRTDLNDIYKDYSLKYRLKGNAPETQSTNSGSSSFKTHEGITFIMKMYEPSTKIFKFQTKNLRIISRL